MARKRTNRTFPITALLLAMLWACAAQGDPMVFDMTWICGGGNYCTDLKCWDPFLGVAPCNVPDQAIFNVTIPAGSGTITVDCDCDVNDFTLGAGREFKAIGGSTYSVDGQANISARIYGNGGGFIAPRASFVGCAAQAWVNGGGYVEIGAPTYCATGLNAYATNYTLLSSTGAGSRLKLSGMTELNDGVSIRRHANADDPYWHQIIAKEGGSMDLSGLTTIVGPSSNDSLLVQAVSGGTIRLGGLTAVSHAGGSGQVKFGVDEAGLVLPRLMAVSDATFHATNGGEISAENQPWTYSATGLNAYATNYTLLSSTGAGSRLKLSGMTELNDGVSIRRHANADDPYWHQIIAKEGGSMDLSGLTKIVGPSSNDSLYIDALSGSSIDLSSLQTIGGTTGSVHFRVDGGSVLCLGSVVTTVSTSITLSDPNDVLYVGGSDLGMTVLGTKVTISNPGRGTLAFAGDFTYAHTDETRIPFDQSYVFCIGDGPQELEVGGFDVGTFVPAIRKDADGNPINFGFGQMIIGRDDRDDPNVAPGAVFLIDRVDNGNRNAGRAEALYLFGKDGQDGLRLLNGSTLYMGGLAVYAMYNGQMTDLRTLFPEGEVKIPFDEGYLCLDKPRVDDPGNLVCNGGFEEGVAPPTAENPVATLPGGSIDIDCWTVGKDMLNWCHESYFADAGTGQRFADLLSSDTGVASVSQAIPTVRGELYHVWFDMTANPYGDAGQRALLVSAAGASEEFACDATTAQPDWQTKTWRFVATDDTTTLTFANAGEPNVPFGVAIDNVIVYRWPAEFKNLVVKITEIDTSYCPVIETTVMVADIDGNAVPDLSWSNFRVYEDGTKQEPISVWLRDPIAVALCLDFSGSMGEEGDPNAALQQMKDGATDFVNLMIDHYDLGEIIKFAMCVDPNHEFTTEKQKLIDAIDPPIGCSRDHTLLYNAIYTAIEDLIEQPVASKAVVVITDGDDLGSEKTKEGIIELAKPNGIPVYTIGLGKHVNAPVLQEIAAATEGLYYYDPNEEDIAEIFETMSELLLGQYVISYDSIGCMSDTGQAGSTHQLKIEVNADVGSGTDTKPFTCPDVCIRP